MQQCLYDNILKPYFENRLIYDNAACREGKGTDFARDCLIKERMHIKHYVRYMDDGVLIHESKDCLNEVLRQMKVKAKELRLEFNQKTRIRPISEGVDFLGFRFYLTDTGKVIRRLRTSNKKRWNRRLKKYKEEYRVGNKGLEDDDYEVIFKAGVTVEVEV